MNSRSILSLLFIWLGAVTQALSTTGQRLLVIADDPSQTTKYSQFLGDLESRGFKTETKTPKSDPHLFLHGARSYDHVLLLPSSLKALGPALTPQTLLNFVKADGNLLVALSSTSSTPSSVTSLLLELDIATPPDRDAQIVDHFNYDTLSAGDKHDVLVIPGPKQKRQDVSDFFALESSDGVIAVPRAVGHTLGNASPLLTPILRAPATAYSYNTKDEADTVDDPFATGSQLGLVSAMQARNSARVTVVGSAEMLEDAWFDTNVQVPGGKKTKSANREFARKLTQWSFKESGVLKVGEVRHWLDEGKDKASGLNKSIVGLDGVVENPKIYRIKNDVTYTIELALHTPSQGYAPFLPPGTDALQLEFSMLSPYHRLPLTPLLTTPNSTVFGASFKLPDQHGIFNFRVNYKRPFLTNVDVKDTVTVRHFAHDEFPRSFAISGAYPWILGVWVTVGGWFLFVLVWLFSEPKDKARAEKKRQ